MTAVGQPPASLSTVVVLTWIAAALDLIAGVVLVFSANSEAMQAAAGESASTVTIVGWTYVVIGLAVALVAVKLRDGSSFARALVTALMLLRVASGLWLLFVAGTHGMTEALLTLVISGTVLFLLWTGPTSEYFARN